MIELGELFDIKYGNQLDLNKLEITTNDCGINFISRQSYNLGVACKVIAQDKLHIFNAGDITVTLGGNYLLSSYIQQRPFYTGQNIKVLTSKVEMTDIEKHFYCYVISRNRFRYTSHGREANKTLDGILVPNIDEIPSWVYTTKKFTAPSDKAYHHKTVSLNDREWGWFMLSDYFTMRTGKYYPKDSFDTGHVPIITAKDTDNGVNAWTNLDPQFTDIGITIGKVGCNTFYQNSNFCISSDVTAIVNPRVLNSYIGMFIVTVINMERPKWSYGRQIRLNDSMNLKVKLPVDNQGEPDWRFMEDYIKSLPYSSSI